MITKTNKLLICKAGEVVTIQGWVHRTRDHGGLTFIDFRDYEGLVQCVFDNYGGTVDYHHLRDESVVRMTGAVRLRPTGTENPNLRTGDIEIEVSEIEILNGADVLPFKVFAEEEEYTPSLEQRLKYRYLDLRRDENQKMLKLRSDVQHFIRNYMHDQEFIEVQTPTLSSTSPEGARDFLIPSRIHKGQVYSLIQSPQIQKQLLMASGVEKYYQLCRCWRDEASRSDRALEFTQLDLEIGFGTQEMVFSLVEPLLTEMFESYGLGWKLNQSPRYDDGDHGFVRIPYKESIEKYGTDKPDLRASLEMTDVTILFKKQGPQFIVDAVESGQIVKAIHLTDADGLSGKFYKDIEKYAQELGMPGLGYVKSGFSVDNGGNPGPLAKMMNAGQLTQLRSIVGFNPLSSDTQATFLMVGHPKAVNAWGADLRVELSKRTKNFDEESYEFCWIVDFPFFEENEETGKIDFSHNPFSMPKGGMEALENKNLLDILACQYDTVLNGMEINSGGERNYNPEIMKKVFEIVGYDESVVEEKFPSLWGAMKLGHPPCAGCAPGIDRLIQLLMFKDGGHIRDVTAFPIGSNGIDLLMGAPSVPSDEQIKELGIKFQKK